MALAGSIWVNGTELLFVDNSGNIWHGTGVLLGNVPTALPGSIYVDGASIFYIDASKNARYLQYFDISAQPAGSLKGSIWVETGTSPNRLNFIDNQVSTRRAAWHSDVAHSDVAHSDSHSDVAHVDYSDKSGHTNVVHVDSHGNVAHSDVAAVTIPTTP